MLEVADIIDELKMMRHLLQTQQDTLMPMALALARLNPSYEDAAEHVTNNIQTEIRIRGDNNNITCETNSAGVLNSDKTENTKVLAQRIDGQSRENIISAYETLLAAVAALEGIRKEAEHTHILVSVKASADAYV